MFGSIKGLASSRLAPRAAGGLHISYACAQSILKPLSPKLDDWDIFRGDVIRDGVCSPKKAS